jgi:hypothetical protein
MIAAYVFVLQTLLASVAITQAAAAGPSADLPLVLCAEHISAPDSLPDQPSKQKLCEHCVACAFATVAFDAPDAFASLTTRFAHRATASPAREAMPAISWCNRQPPPRGPPQTA